MWDFLKKAAGAVVEAGATYVVQSAAVDRILQAPDFETGKSSLRAHVFELEGEGDLTTLLTIIETRYNQAVEAARQGGYDGSWGNTVEDRMAYSMAHLRSGTPMRNQEAERMVGIYEAMHHFTKLFWEEAQAHRASQGPQPPAATPLLQTQAQDAAEPDPTPEPTAGERAAAMRRHMDAINAAFPASAPLHGAEDLEGDGTLDEIAAMSLRIEADSTLTQAMMQSMPGQVTDAVLDSLDEVYDKYALLRDRAPQDSSLFDRADFVYGMGQAREFAGNACENMPAGAEMHVFQERAIANFREAEELFAEAGRTEDANRVARKIAVSEEILTGAQAEPPADLHVPRDAPIAEAERLLDLASYSKADPKAAIDMIHRAETLLKQNGLEEPAGEDLAQSMSQLIAALGTGTLEGGTETITQQVKLRGLYSSIYQMLHQLYMRTPDDDPDWSRDQALATHYMSRFEALDGQQKNKAFSDALSDLMGLDRSD